MFKIRCEVIKDIPPKCKVEEFTVYDIQREDENIKFLIYDRYNGCWIYIDSSNCVPVN